MEATVIDIPIHLPHRGHAVLALKPAGPELRTVKLLEENAISDARQATRWFGVRHVVAPVRNGKVEVLV